MKSKLTASQRLGVIEKILQGDSISKVVKGAGISRTILSKWLKRYKEEGERGLIPLKAGRPRRTKPEKRLGARKILTSPERLRMVQEVLEEGVRAGEVAKKYGVSRVTLYKWINRFKEEPDKRLAAVEDKKREVSHYFRQTPDKYEEVILNVVAQHPEYGVRKILLEVPKIGGKPIVGHHGIQNVLTRHSLATYDARLAYAQAQETPITRTIKSLLGVATRFFAIPQIPRTRIVRFGAIAALSMFATVVVFGLGSFLADSYVSASLATRIGLVFATSALLFGSIFFLYSLKYYISLAIVLSFSQQQIGIKKSLIKGKGIISWIMGLASGEAQGSAWEKKATGLEPNLEHIKLTRYPKISVHVPLYNEKNVVERMLSSATALDYPGDYEVIIADDSTDETSQIIENYLKAQSSKLKSQNGDGWTLTQGELREGVILKHLHRTSRQGFKGGALRLALSVTDPKAEFVTVFDADFVPYSDTLELFLKYFSAVAEAKADGQVTGELKSLGNIAAVQGYQWHVLNKSENWITRGVRSEYAGSYVIERSGAEIYTGLKQISGSVYMIRKDVLEEIGWGTSITEDFQLTLKLYEKGYKVVYTPYIQAPAECVSTLKRLIRQRMRWAEGHSNNIRKMFVRLLFGHWKNADVENSNVKTQMSKVFVPSPLTLSEKVEFLYLGPYYLQAFFFLVGTISWLISEAIFPARLPFWTSLWGWSLVLTNMFSLPLVNAVGLFLEESEERDYLGIASFFAMSYVLVPFQAYAAVKGFIQKEEGPWFRTPKTGKITDIFTRGKFYRFISGILPGRSPQPAVVHAKGTRQWALGFRGLMPKPYNLNPNPYLSLATANNRFQAFQIPRHKIRWIGNLVLVLTISLTLVIASLAPSISESGLNVSAQESQFATLSDASSDSTIFSQGETEQEITEPILVQFVAGGGKYLEYIFHQEPRVRTKFSGKEIEMTLVDAEGLGKANPEKSIKEKGEFKYQDVWPSIDLYLVPEKGKLTEKVVLNNYQDLTTLEYDLKLIGLEPALFEGEIVLANKEGGPGLFSFTQPYMYEEGSPKEKNFGIVYQLEKKAIGWELKKVLTQEGKQWLADPSRIFPVVIDPTQYTLVIQGSLNATETQFSSVQRKIAYSTRGAETDAWYAVYEEASGADVFWTRCLVPCDGSTNTWANDTEMDNEASDDDESPTLWMEGTDLYAAWFDNGSDGPKWRSWETAAEPESANQNSCQADDVGTVGAGLVSIAVADDGEVYTAQITDGQSSTEITISKSTSACSNSDISSNGTAGGLTQSDAHAMVTIGNNLLLIYNDGDLSASSYVDDASPAWDQTNIDINGGAAANAEEDFSVTTDGTDVWVLQAISTTDTELWKCAACNLSSQSWSSQTAPFTGFSNGSDVSISYISGSNQLVAMSAQGSGTGEQVHWKTSDADSISWSSDNTYGFTAGSSGLDRLSSTLAGADDEQIAATVLETTNSEWEFSTLPEKTLVLLFTLPLLSKFLYFGKRKKQHRGEV